MELPISQEVEIPAPINSTYGHGHIIHHHHHQHDQPSSHNHHIIIPSSSSAPSNGNTTINPQEDEMEEEEEEQNHHVQSNYKKKQQQVVIRYRECLKNHAAAMGGSAVDGCGEFMPSGEEGTIEALACSACNCHRNFHRREIEGDPSASSSCDCYHLINRGGGRKIISLAHHHNKGILPPEAFGYPTTGGTLVPATRSVPIMPYNNMGFLPSESDEQEDGGGGGFVSRGPLQVAAPLQQQHYHHHQGAKKRFRTKFTQEQKEKMLNFAEKVGWKIQKQEEGVVQQFCQEIGVKRRVLKVWMHNNKHNLAKKNSSSTTVA